MPKTPLDPSQVLDRLAQAARPSPARTFVRDTRAVLIAALDAGHSGSALYRALIALGQPPPMSLRQFRRYLAALRTPGAAGGRPAPAASPTPLAPARFHWDPLRDDPDIR